MCGFIGYIIKNSCPEKQKINYQQKAENSLKKMLYRGPDFQDKKIFNKDNYNFFLGFNRLAIQDLNDEANKIFINDKYALLFNGEIYNFLQLKKEYLNEDKFETKTDTEVLFKLLSKYGVKIIEKLEGMFSFVFFDFKKNDFFLCKDATGIKPLYYFQNNEGIFFSSEAWFLYSLSNKKINLASLKYYFQLGFSPNDCTLINGVKKIEHGSYLKYSPTNTNKINFFYKIPKKIVKKEFSNIDRLLNTVIEKNLVSDVNVGVFMSGGLDSSIIAAKSKKIKSNIEGYTSYFTPHHKYKKFNVDLEYAEKLSKKLDIKINKIEINDNDNYHQDNILSLMKNFDEPLPNMNFYNSYLQFKNAKENNCKVILTGDGADEIFGGYRRYRVMYIYRKLDFLKSLNKKIKKYNSLDNFSLIKEFYKKIDLNKYANLFQKNFYNNLIKSEDCNLTLNEINQEDNLNYFDINYWLSEEANYKLDRSSMFASVEARVPFQDVNLINQYYTEKIEHKVNFLNEKILLKNEIQDVPKFILKRKKQGWFTPESSYLRSIIKKIGQDLINEAPQEIFDRENLNKLFTSHLDGKYFKNEIFCIVNFLQWYKALNINN